MSGRRRLACRGLAAFLTLILGLPPALASEFILCGSDDGRYRVCPIDTGGSARLVDQYSRTRCEEGRTWGYDRRGVWVDDGCRGRFEVDYRSGLSDKDKKAAAGALVGLAILAAAAQASKDRDRDRDYDSGSRVPSWAVGTFEGYNPIYRAEVTLKVFPSGEVIVYQDNRRAGEGTFEDSSIYLDRVRLRVEREGSGFRTIQANDPGNVVSYRPVD